MGHGDFAGEIIPDPTLKNGAAGGIRQQKTIEDRYPILNVT